MRKEVNKSEWCPIIASLDVLGRRWHLVVIDRLMDGAKRFSELKRSISPVSNKVLSQTLKEMEKDGLIQRIVISGYPVMVRYSLTPKGSELRRVLKELRAWGERWLSPDNEVPEPRRSTIKDDRKYKLHE